MVTQEEKYINMTQKPVGRVIGKLAIPCIASMLVTSLYNMADTFFVGKLNSNSAEHKCSGYASSVCDTACGNHRN